MELLDEKIVKAEVKEEKRKQTEKKVKEIQRQIKEKEQMAKTVEDFKTELLSGKVKINGNLYECEQHLIMEGRVKWYVFPKDIQKEQDREILYITEYGQLQMSCQMSFTDKKIVVKNIKDYMKQVRELYEAQKMSLNWIDSGTIYSAGIKISYCTAMVPTAVGTVFLYIRSRT